eukprot:gnl/Dysnectes_brevis/2735_a3324_719.p1 GENE.gnl/Dysnectes_brevis/2735_a3324_719~~gnl/Dysnectes_brevis/2735_a3324_719.p1  ORF type:complete len:378 (-),score=110.16 gnl/Dysnectes_brevis/2735_a3324_719:1038-2171(-)
MSYHKLPTCDPSTPTVPPLISSVPPPRGSPSRMSRVNSKLSALSSLSITNKVKLCVFQDDGDQFVSSTHSVDKRSIAERLRISNRDIRNLLVDVSTIEPRDHVIILSITQLNCMITSSTLEVILDNTYATKQLVRNLPRTYSEVRSFGVRASFELMALEAVLLHTTRVLQHRYADITVLSSIFSDLSLGMEPRARVVPILHKLSELETDIGDAETTLSDLLDDEEDVTQLAFANKAALSAGDDAHLPVPLLELVDLLESYHSQLTSLQTEVRELATSAQQRIELAQLRLDHLRNKQLVFTLGIATATFAVSVGNLLAGIIGINFLNPAFPGDYTDPDGYFGPWFALHPDCLAPFWLSVAACVALSVGVYAAMRKSFF